MRGTVRRMGSLKENLQSSLGFFPEHRRRTKRTQKLNLDILLEDFRLQQTLDPGALDFILMGYRYGHLFERELGKFLGKPLEPAELKDLLQATFGALLTRDKTPISALVSEAVNVSREFFGARTAGISNAFLRNCTRNLEALKKEVQTSPQLLLGKSFSSRWKSEPNLLSRFGSQLAERPEPGISGFSVSGEYSNVILKDNKVDFSNFQAMDKGSWFFVEYIRECLKGEKVASLLDACAAPGGKLLALWSLLTKETRLYAADSKFPRLEKLRENIARWPLENKPESALFEWGSNPQIPANWPQEFDVVLADLPCSGSGTLHTRPDIIFSDLAERVKNLQKLQEEILLSLRKLKFRHLFVSICSVDPEEIANVGACLDKANPDFSSFKSHEKTLEGITGWHLLS